MSSGQASAVSSGRLADERRIVGEVAAAVGLAEGERGVRAVLSALARLEPVSTRRISRAAEQPVPIVAAVCGELLWALSIARAAHWDRSVRAIYPSDLRHP